MAQSSNTPSGVVPRRLRYIVGWWAPLGSLASPDSSSRWQGAVVAVPAASLRGRRDSIHAVGRRHWPGRIDRADENGPGANGGRRTSPLTSLPSEWLFSLYRASWRQKRSAFLGGEPALRSFLRRAHDFLRPAKRRKVGRFCFSASKSPPVLCLRRIRPPTRCGNRRGTPPRTWKTGLQFRNRPFVPVKFPVGCPATFTWDSASESSSAGKRRSAASARPCAQNKK